MNTRAPVDTEYPTKLPVVKLVRSELRAAAQGLVREVLSIPDPLKAGPLDERRAQRDRGRAPKERLGHNNKKRCGNFD